MVLQRVPDVSPEAAIRMLIDRAIRSVAGCCGATSTVWNGRERARRISSHPDLARLLDREATLTDSPMRSAARAMQPTRVTDTLSDTRWPRFCVEALRVGVRSLVVGVTQVGPSTVTLMLYSLVPDGLAAQSAAMCTALIEEGEVMLARVSTYAGMRREAHHLGEAIAAREVIEQAKGMIMQATGCDAEAAFDELVLTSQRGHLKIADVAKHLVEAHAGGGSPTPARPDGSPARSSAG